LKNEILKKYDKEIDKDIDVESYYSIYGKEPSVDIISIEYRISNVQ
jgi:hypothetical protein